MHTYRLSLDDILNPLLFDLSTSTQKMAKRKRSFWYTVLLTALIGAGGFVFHDLFIGLTFLAISLLYLLFGNWYRRLAYRRSLKKSIRKNYAALAGSPVHLDLRKDDLYIDTEAGDASYSYSSFQNITETYAYFFIRLDNDQILGIPKFCDELVAEFKQRISANHLTFEEQPGWKY